MIAGMDRVDKVDWVDWVDEEVGMVVHAAGM